MDGDYWIPIVTDPKLTSEEKETKVIDLYVAKLKEFFGFVYSVPVQDDTPEYDGVSLPKDCVAKYHLIFATRSRKAVVLMNDVAHLAREPYMNTFCEGLLFPVLPGRLEATTPDAIRSEIVKLIGSKTMLRTEICEELISKHFLEYRTKHYNEFLREMVKDGILFHDPSIKLSGGRLNDTIGLRTSPWKVQQ